jgi:competence protein ComEC
MAHLTFNFIDVGQGDGTFIIFPDGSQMLVDLGSLKNSKIIKPEYVSFFNNYWKPGGGPNNKLALLVLTHGDQDHYNLIKPLFDHYDLDVARIYITGEETDYYVGGFDDKFLKPWRKKGRLKPFVSNCSNGKKVWKSFGGANIYLLLANFPTYDDTNTNDKSVVMLFEYMGNKMIIGGDATKKTEKEVVRYFTDYIKDPGFLRSDFMKVNHHGSETSSCSEWITAVKPRYAFISADMHDGYLLPRCPVIQRIVDDGNIATDWVKHPYVCYDRDQDDWFNHDDKLGIFNSLAKYTEEADEVTGHGVRYTVTFKDDGGAEIANSGYPTLFLPAPDSGKHGL